LFIIFVYSGLSFFENIGSLFLTCSKLNLLSDSYINNILKKDFKLIIRGNNLNNVKKSYMLIYKIYGNNFNFERSKLKGLAVQSLLTNNIELLELIHKAASSTMESEDTVYDLFANALNIKSLKLINYLLEKYQIIDNFLIERIVTHYYVNKIDSPLILKSILDKNKDKDEIMMNASLNERIFSSYPIHL
jgi:hypothetical protein